MSLFPMKNTLRFCGPAFLLTLLTACGQSEEAADTAVSDTPDRDVAARIADLEAMVTDAERRVDRLKSTHEIKNLMAAYSYYVDKSMHDDVADLFSEDAVLEILGRGQFIGLERVREYMHNFGPVGPAENGLFNHIQFQPVVTVHEDGNSAEARGRLFVMFGRITENGPPNAQFGEGTYENDFVRGEDGIWRFSLLHGYQGHYTLYEDGWAKRSSAIFAPYEDFPPDAPQSVDYDPYPAAYVPPFHYDSER